MITFKDIIEKNNNTGDSSTRVHFVYKLKNGKEFSRVYRVKSGTNNSIMTELYEYDDYVVANEDAFRDDKIMAVSFVGSDYEKHIDDPQKAAEFVECFKKDILSMKYNEMYINSYHWNISFEIQYEMQTYYDDRPVATSTVAVVGNDMEMQKTAYIDYAHHSINANYKNTIKWLSDNGYGNVGRLNLNSPVTIVDMSGLERDDYKSYYEMADNGVKIAEIDTPEKYHLIADFVVNMPVDGGIEDEYIYAVYQKPENDDIVRITDMTKANVDELLQKIK